jgi:hypothetical protein
MSDIARKIAVQRACQAAIGDGVHQRLIAQQPNSESLCDSTSNG